MEVHIQDVIAKLAAIKEEHGNIPFQLGMFINGSAAFFDCGIEVYMKPTSSTGEKKPVAILRKDK